MSAQNIVFSPKTYLQKILYDNIPQLRKKRHKISQEEFNIPDYHEYDQILEYNYNVGQLKTMCKYYNQKQSGNKDELTKRMYNFLKYSTSAILIQKHFRRHLIQRYIHAHGPAIMCKNKCVNDTDFLTLEPIENIPHYQFYSFTDKDDFTYSFDICSLYNLYQNNQHATNPYNRNEFPKGTLRKLRTLIRLCRVLKYPVTIDITEDPQTNADPAHQLNMRINDVFQKIDALGNYSDSEWFKSLSKPRLLRFLRELFDIWTYRAQLQQSVKRDIYPPHGTPFRETNLRHINNQNEHDIKVTLIELIDKLVTRGVDESSRSLGAYYCLAALTIVNTDAAQALPWLYQSVV